MMKVGKVTVLGQRYNIAAAPATQQKELLLLVGARLSLRVAASGSKEIDPGMLLGALLTFKEEEIERIADLAMGQCFKHGSTQPVDEHDFQDNIHGYFILMAEAIKVNLDPFFNWLVSEKPAAKETASPASQTA